MKVSPFDLYNFSNFDLSIFEKIFKILSWVFQDMKWGLWELLMKLVVMEFFLKLVYKILWLKYVKLRKFVAY